MPSVYFFQQLHSFPQVLHDCIHVCFGRPPAHAQPQGISCHLWGDATAQKDMGRPDGQTQRSAGELCNCDQYGVWTKA